MLHAPRAVAAAAALAIALLSASCASSGAKDATSETPEEAAAAKTPAELCQVQPPCPNAKQAAPEFAACIAAMRDLLSDPCLGPMIALKSCSLETARCTAVGSEDDNATPAVTSDCAEEARAFQSCCGGGKESAFCP